MTTPEMIQHVGEALFGTSWQTDMSVHLAVNRRTVARWLTGYSEPQAGVWADLEQVLGERVALQLKVREELVKWQRSRNAEAERGSDETTQEQSKAGG